MHCGEQVAVILELIGHRILRRLDFVKRVLIFVLEIFERVKLGLQLFLFRIPLGFQLFFIPIGFQLRNFIKNCLPLGCFSLFQLVILFFDLLLIICKLLRRLLIAFLLLHRGQLVIKLLLLVKQCVVKLVRYFQHLFFALGHTKRPAAHNHKADFVAEYTRRRVNAKKTFGLIHSRGNHITNRAYYARNTRSNTVNKALNDLRSNA